jgi:hypothetical protein
MSAYWYSSRSLGQHLELYDEDRERLQAWMVGAVDVTPEQRKAINKEKHRKVQERARRKSGAIPRDVYLNAAASRTKPWEALGMGRTKYYDLGLHLTDGGGQVRDDLLYLRNDKSRSCPQAVSQVRDDLLLVPSLPPGWPYCAEHIAIRDGIQRRTLQGICLGKSRVPIPATEYQEAA